MKRIILFGVLLILMTALVSCNKIAFDDDGVFEFYQAEGGYFVAVRDPEYVQYMESVEIPMLYKLKPVVGIANNGFAGCSNLKRITIPSSVETIGDYAFAGCTGLTSVTIPDSVTSIGDRAFLDCYKLVEVINESSLTITEGSSYNGNVAHYAIEVHTGDSKIVNKDGYLFYTYVGINYLVGYVGDDTDLILPENYNGESYEICNYAFYNCKSLTSVTIPDSVTSIGDSAFHNTAYYNKSSNWENDVLYIGKHLIEAKETLSGTYQIKEGTLCIGDGAFYRCTGLTSVTIPDSVTSIGYDAFAYCDRLQSVIIPDSVTSIGSNMFSGCTSLTSVTIPDSVTSIGESAFSSCTSLTSVTIPDSVTSIGDYAFYSCGSLTSITIPDSVTSIGFSAFEDCRSLMSVTIGNSVTSIGFSAFEDCRSLTSITIPDSVTSIDKWAFSGCNSALYTEYEYGKYVRSGDNPYAILVELTNENLSTYTINENTKIIVNSLFSNCDFLTNITIPDSVTIIGEDAFYWCKSLTSVTIGNSVTSIGAGAFSDCYSLTSVTIGNSVTSIGEWAFYWCESLTSITIPDGVTSIGSVVFCDCTSLTSVTIPDSVTSIGYWAFYNCRDLTSIKYRGTEAEWVAISKGNEWDKDSGAYGITYNYDGE